MWVTYCKRKGEVRRNIRGMEVNKGLVGWCAVKFHFQLKKIGLDIMVFFYFGSHPLLSACPSPTSRCWKSYNSAPRLHIPNKLPVSHYLGRPTNKEESLKISCWIEAKGFKIPNSNHIYPLLWFPGTNQKVCNNQTFAAGSKEGTTSLHQRQTLILRRFRFRQG